MTQKFQQRKTRRGWETVAGAALAVGAVVGNGAVAQTVLSPVPTAVSANEDTGGSQQSKTTSDHEFHIPAGTLTDALSAYQRETGLKVNIKIAVDELVGFRTAGVEGTFSNSAALRQLLDKTGLSYHFEGTDSVDIAIRNAEHVDVTSSVSSIALQQFPESLLDTAQTVNVVPQYIMQEQGTTTLRDGLRNVPGISMAAGEGGSQGDTLTIRGFNARNDIYLEIRKASSHNSTSLFMATRSLVPTRCAAFQPI
jgi:catecholate siderophore receptor